MKKALLQVLTLCVFLNFRYSLKYFAHINLESSVWSHHVAVPLWDTNMAARKSVLTSGTYFGYLGN